MTNFKTKFENSIKANLVIFALLSTCLLSPMLLSPARAAGEIKATDTAARTLYAVIENPAGQVWNGSSFAAYADANWAAYAVSVPEQGTSQQYVGNMPAGITTAARYSVIIYERQGAGAAVTDPVVGQGILDWTGTALASEGINTNTLTTIGATTTSTNGLATGINTQTAKIGTNGMDSPNEITAQGLVTSTNAQAAKISTNAMDSPNEVTAQGNAGTILTQTSSTVRQADMTAGLTTQGYTAARAPKLDNADVAISSRSTYAGGDTSGVTNLLSRLGSPVGATLSADIASVKADKGGLTTSVAALPASTVAALFGASFITIPGSNTTTGTGEVLTYKQFLSLSDAVLGGDNTSTVPTASGTAAVTYYLRGQPKIPANVVAVPTVSYDAAKNQTGRVVLIAQPYPSF